ncbi:programmed cell death protein 2 [Hetaerina americana]|uniref:programmed cell death protein 2 n=1 Tax=Hetaerina americana TaxID=62018 RepID=UPI003A7F3C57
MSSNDSSESSEELLQIGFANECHPWRLESRFFPSKIGGKPAWLGFSDLPSGKDLCCEKCDKTTIHLCQIYAPIDNKPSCFHRSLMVFCCRNPECCDENDSRNFKVFRCQLPRANDFYPFDPPIEEESWRPDIKAEKYNTLCHICGNKSSSKCSRCKTLFYCSKDHQAIDWKAGHKAECSRVLSMEKVKNRLNEILLKEFEISIETEESEDDLEVNEQEAMKEYEDLVIKGRTGTLNGEATVDEDLTAMALKEDKTYEKFRKKIHSNPDQVLRYERGGKPLWVSANNIPKETDLPKCPYCHEKRQFEFQVLPQMLSYLQMDDIGKSIDWGTLVIFTCSESCDSGPAYKKEVIWKQDFSYEST